LYWSSQKASADFAGKHEVLATAAEIDIANVFVNVDLRSLLFGLTLIIHLIDFFAFFGL